MNEELSFFLYKKAGLALESCPIEQAHIIVLGIPFDSTQTGGTGSRYGPTSIRLASYELEHYDFSTNTDLSDIMLADIGDIDCVPGSATLTLERLESTLNYIPSDTFLISLGGEHSVSTPIVKYLSPDMVVSFDAHPDLRNSYMGNEDSHSSVMRRIHESGKDITLIGVREGSKEEHDYAIENNIHIYGAENCNDVKLPCGKRIYISIDLDVFESYMNVGNPVPGGMQFNDVCSKLSTLFRDNDVCGVDIVELCSIGPDNSAMVAAKLLFKIIAYHKTHEKK